tara:strand:+ start:336 stop:509 length:174 start_codon:yes stop_codon:yes gene_type:complete
MSKCCNNKKKCSNKVESQLNCKATAELNSQIAEELSEPDAALAELLKEKEKDDEGEV